MTPTKMAKFFQLFVHNVHLGFEPDVHVSLCGPGLFVYPLPRPYQPLFLKGQDCAFPLGISCI